MKVRKKLLRMDITCTNYNTHTNSLPPPASCKQTALTFTWSWSWSWAPSWQCRLLYFWVIITQFHNAFEEAGGCLGLSWAICHGIWIWKRKQRRWIANDQLANIRADVTAGWAQARTPRGWNQKPPNGPTHVDKWVRRIRKASQLHK